MELNRYLQLPQAEAQAMPVLLESTSSVVVVGWVLSSRAVAFCVGADVNMSAHALKTEFEHRTCVEHSQYS